MLHLALVGVRDAFLCFLRISGVEVHDATTTTPTSLIQSLLPIIVASPLLSPSLMYNVCLVVGVENRLAVALIRVVGAGSCELHVD